MTLRRAIIGLAAATVVVLGLLTNGSGYSPAAAAPQPSLVASFSLVASDLVSCTGVVCKDNQTGTVSYSGQLNGSSVFSGEITFMPPGGFSAFTSTYREVFSGTVEGCGTGTLVFRGTDVLNLVGHLHASFTVIGGTGELAHFRGHGTVIYNPDFLSGTITIDGHC